jgi:hypothetical protein
LSSSENFGLRPSCRTIGSGQVGLGRVYRVGQPMIRYSTHGALSRTKYKAAPLSAACLHKLDVLTPTSCCMQQIPSEFTTWFGRDARAARVGDGATARSSVQRRRDGAVVGRQRLGGVRGRARCQGRVERGGVQARATRGGHRPGSRHDWLLHAIMHGSCM